MSPLVLATSHTLDFLQKIQHEIRKATGLSLFLVRSPIFLKTVHGLNKSTAATVKHNCRIRLRMLSVMRYETNSVWGGLWKTEAPEGKTKKGPSPNGAKPLNLYHESWYIPRISGPMYSERKPFRQKGQVYLSKTWLLLSTGSEKVCRQTIQMTSPRRIFTAAQRQYEIAAMSDAIAARVRHIENCDLLTIAIVTLAHWWPLLYYRRRATWCVMNDTLT